MAAVLTQLQAEDAILGLVRTTWIANTPASTPLLYDNKDAARPETPSLFGRTVLRHFGSTRETLGPTGANTSVHRRRGTVFMQIFVPQGTGTDVVRAIAEAMEQAFEDSGSSLGVRLTDVGTQELGGDGTYYQVNVKAAFSYDRIS